MLIDDITISVKAGDGGNGAVAFLPMKGGPSGGNGGKGGDVYLIGINDIEALSQFRFKKELFAENGQPGGKADKDGRNAPDLYIKVPIGTRISVNDSDWIHEIKDAKSPFLVARGGKGGLGNDEFKSSTNRTPRYAESGKPGQLKKVHLQLRLIANIGLVGLPNAGKSSLLHALTKATPKIADYPFTTLDPNLGVMLLAKNRSLILADIPGLIEGASAGRGLGIKFLKHIEKTTLIAHCIDASQDDLIKIYNTVRLEFKKYNPEILDKEEIILLTKTDLLTEKEISAKQKTLKKLNKTIIPISIIDDEGISNLKEIFQKTFFGTKKIVREE